MAGVKFRGKPVAAGLMVVGDDRYRGPRYCAVVMWLQVCVKWVLASRGLLTDSYGRGHCEFA